MNKREYLLTCLSEECAEAIKEVSKVLRFGEYGVNPNEPQSGTNIDRLSAECDDIYAMLVMLSDKGIISPINLDAVRKKRIKVSNYMDEKFNAGSSYLICTTVSGKYSVRPSTWAGLWEDGKLDDKACRSLGYFDSHIDAERFINMLEENEHG